jgi:Tol biopolymer transport system component
MTHRSDLESASHQDPLQTPTGRQAIAEELARIMASPLFERAPAMRRLLQFLVENDLQGVPSELKETTIGAAVYGRSPTYDPGKDAVVRVNANRLRTRLEEYFQTHSGARIQIEIPRGSYVPTYRHLVGSTAESTGAVAGNPALETLTQAAQAEPLPGAASGNGSAPYGSAGSGFPGMERRRPAWVLLSVALLLVVCAVAVSLARHRKQQAGWDANGWWAKLYLAREGRETFTAFSPDGRRLAYVLSASGNHDGLFVQDIDSGASAEVANTTALDSRPAWSPDGRRIAWVHTDSNDRKEVMLSGAELSGTPARIASVQGAFPWLCQVPKLSWSRDGNFLYTSAAITTNGTCRIVEINVANGVVRPLTYSQDSSIADVEATVSPDGRQLAFLRNSSTLMGDIFVLNLETGAARQVTHDRRDILGLCWDADGQGILLASRRVDGSGRLWHLSLSAGKYELMWSGTGTAGFPTIDPRGTRVIFTVYRNETSIWRISAEGSRRLLYNGTFLSSPQSSPDGKHMAYTSDQTGPLEIWMSDSEGKENHRLTNLQGSMANNPAWSPDGQTIAFECRDQSSSDICLMGSDGSRVRHLTQWTSEQTLPSWSRDERRLFFTSNHSGRPEIYSAVPDKGEPQPVTTEGGLRAVPLDYEPGLLIWKGAVEGGLTCVAIPPAPLASPCLFGGLLHPPTGWDGRNWWDVSPDGLWWVKPGSAGFDIYQSNLHSGAARKLFSSSGSVTSGDRTFSVEPGGHTALYVQPESDRADTVLLERAHPRS